MGWYKMMVNILIIDSVQDTLLYTESLIKDFRCSMHIDILKASSSKEAIQIAEDKDIHLIILDTQIDDANGFELAAQLQEFSNRRETPIIFLTETFNPKNFIDNGYKPATFDYFTKPLERYQFLSKISLYLKLYINKKELFEYKKAIDYSTIVSKANLKGIITYVNDKFCEISGYTQEELIGKPHNIIRSPNMPKETFSNLWTTIQSKQYWEGIVENRAKNGNSYFVKASITPILDEKNEIVEYISIREDITELKALQLDELSSSIDKALNINFQETVDFMPLPTAIVDKNSQIQFSNNLFKEMFSFIENRALDSCFIEQDDYIYSDDIFDWKDIVLNSEYQTKVLINIFGEKKVFYVDIKRVDLNSLFTVCFHCIE